MGLKEEEREKIQINIYLNEYQACHRNRDNYASIRWSVGSIFIAGSLTLVGLSFPLIQKAELLALMVISFLLMVVWFLYNQKLTKYTLLSIFRMHEIEQELRNMGYKIRLHKSIFKPPEIRGTHINFILCSTVILAWYFRFILYLLNQLVWNWMSFGIGTFITLAFLAYLKNWIERSSLNIGDRIQEVLT